MSKRTPYTPRNITPDGDGMVMIHHGKYARETVWTVFEMIGGTERFADWASRNPTDFYTKIIPKTITKEVDVKDERSVEDVLREVDHERPHVIDGEYVTVEDE